MMKSNIITTNWPTLLVITSGVFLVVAHLMEFFNFHPTTYRALFIIYYLMLLVIDYNEDGKIGMFRIVLIGLVVLLVGISLVSL